ncbi:o-succinylbenzoate synthase [Flavobacteriaceae bacterium S356]|uniref:O-succinylbenzoate synthase n=1 Tax=Asprobacillus argus TaxID=3076534 RepID=A0ABU3LGW1_9FLAO|nr:o-succinylbenzoate synthase [Flavobacteriaceae bacterium S356]
MRASYKKYVLNFKVPSGTSRGVLRTKETWFIVLKENDAIGIGECGILRTLSIDDRPDYEEKIWWVCKNIHLGLEWLLENVMEFPSIQFGLEQAFLSLQSRTPFSLYPSKFTKGQDAIDINGLIWMGDKAYMSNQIKEKINAGFSCIKMKIGAIDFETELDLLSFIRNEFSSKEIEVRVDANGAFSPNTALEKLKRLSDLDLHSIEQPIKAGQFNEMAQLCETSPLAIALDEELIGVFSVTKKEEVLQTINPQYIILKPSLVGGYSGSEEWISLAKKQGIGWWVTSALESNVGLNAIAQWTYTLSSDLPQGLGTGSLFTNNIKSPLEVTNGRLSYHKKKHWNFNIE